MTQVENLSTSLMRKFFTSSATSSLSELQCNDVEGGAVESEVTEHTKSVLVTRACGLEVDGENSDDPLNGTIWGASRFNCCKKV